MHENIAAVDLAGGLARQEPELAADILWGARALLTVEGALGAARCWTPGSAATSSRAAAAASAGRRAAAALARRSAP